MLVSVFHTQHRGATNKLHTLSECLLEEPRGFNFSQQLVLIEVLFTPEQDELCPIDDRRTSVFFKAKISEHTM